MPRFALAGHGQQQPRPHDFNGPQIELVRINYQFKREEKAGSFKVYNIGSGVGPSGGLHNIRRSH
jgi:hypothetical protein